MTEAAATATVPEETGAAPEATPEADPTSDSPKSTPRRR